ncbi:unnamed protein product [Somion occarium]|uniref:3-beta hydroxysteroid dehydrogenase/isomerase domain-containing protein n=1 Tax=Somion occarium TaxID=3059160 RepID=A0ABP1E8X0_9APHY
MSSNATRPSKVFLVTGATGFIGAHVLDELLRRGHKVRGAARSKVKADRMIRDRPQYSGSLEFTFIDDLTSPGVFDKAVQGVDGILHVASPVNYEVDDVEKELLLPAIEGTKSILGAAKREPSVKRLVFTSSFAAVFNPSGGASRGFTYTSDVWNPITFEEAKNADPVQAYRGAKKYAEQAAWDCIRNDKPHFDLVTFCPPLVFGPLAHPITKVSELNESNKHLWAIAARVDPLPVARVPVWVDVRDLAFAHVEALLRPEISNRRFTIASPEHFTYQRVADVLREELDWAKEQVTKGEEGAPLPETFDVDGKTVAEALGFQYRSFKQTILDAVTQFKVIHERETQA